MKYDFYAYTDKALKYLRRLFITEFNRVSMQIRTDSLNVIQATTALYDKLQRETIRVFLKIAKQKYRELTGGEDTITEMWLLGFLSESNPLTGYVFLNDIERKRQYYTEGLLSGDDISKETKKALRYWYSSVKQYADLVADESALKAYSDMSVANVEWITNLDGKECYICHERNGVIYPITNVPKKPHYGCRCYVRRV